MTEIVCSDIACYAKLTAVGVIGVSGTISNGISLSFFLRHQRESLADLHLIALNFTDLLICCLSPAACFCLNEYHVKHTEGYDASVTLIYLVIIESFLALSNLSCFITTMLSVLRTLVLTNPLHIIRKNYVYLSHGINMMFILGLVTSKIIVQSIDEKQEASNQSYTSDSLSVLTLIFYVLQYMYVLITVGFVGISGVIVVRALRRPPEILTQQNGGANDEANRKATIMILTLLVIFVILNGTWIIVWTMYTVLEQLLDSVEVEIFEIYAMFIGFFLIAANSCANPVVYMLKNSRLNNYTKSLFRRFKRFLMAFITFEVEDEIENPEDVQAPATIVV